MAKQYGTPGPRALYPDACTSPSLAACDALAQLLFDRLLTLADDQGRVQLEPNWVKANAVPFVSEASPKRIARWIAQLSANEVLITYVASNVPLGQFVTWWNRQAGQRRAYPSRWPAPPGWDQDRTYGLPSDKSPGAMNDPKRPKVPAPRGQDAGTLRAERGQDAGKVPDQNPHSRAERAPDSVPLPVPVPPTGDTTPTQPSRRAGGRRADGTNPRALGTNPRALGTNGRAAVGTKYAHLVQTDDPEPAVDWMPGEAKP